MREKDRVSRWREEVILRRTDLECSLRWFHHHNETWRVRRDTTAKVKQQGHLAYAEKQMSVWKALEDRAKAALVDTEKVYSQVSFLKSTNAL